MTARPNNPLGALVDSSSRPMPSNDIQLTGRYVTLVGLRSEHADPLYADVAGDQHAHLWDYMLNGPFASREDFRAFVSSKAVAKDTVFYAILSNTQKDASAPEGQKVLGLASYLRIDPTHQSIEVGNILYTAPLQRTPAATESMYLMAKYALGDLKYRRYEWKCHALNMPSRRAAVRLGFVEEGLFRQHFIIKGRSRDTAWFSILGEEWPDRRAEIEKWLEPANFDGQGKQKKRLEEFRN